MHTETNLRPRVRRVESSSVEFAFKAVSNRERRFALYFVPYNPIRWYEVGRELKLHAEFPLAEAKGGLLGLERGLERVC